MTARSKRIILLTSSYSRSVGDPSLINDLSAQLATDGHQVTVVAMDWRDRPETSSAHYREPNGTEVLFLIPPPLPRRTIFRRGLRFLTAASSLVRDARRAMRGRDFDLMIVIAPLTQQRALIKWAKRSFTCRSYVYVTDFFPFHHQQIGAMPGGAVARIAYLVEASLLRMFDVIGCMSPANIRYLKSHYRLKPTQRVEELSLWGPTDPPPAEDQATVRGRFDLPLDRPIVAYGGQLSAGRGFDVVLEAARLASESRPDLFFLIIGEGPLAGMIAEAAGRQGNIAVKPRVPRESYLSLLAACDVGLVCTVTGVDVPTFPSKTIDMLRAGVPIAAAVESTTDYADFVRDNEIGVAVEAGSGARLLGAIVTIVDDPAAAARMAAAGRATLERVFDVAKVSRRLVAQSFPEEYAA
ncbi:glycosyltransferase family 4 protein [Sphingomonas crusticola]|uniref:glycosyltransferase family 4 protein n=1 Tax=Sphingomonas crusticola TaxID=1697973 RepID=UPI000E22EBA7|nr:glycosyltransferase family 4 protein [Sphingomonas crusticola]